MPETPPSNVPDELSKQNRYRSIIDKIFFDRYVPGSTVTSFERTDLKDAVTFLDIDLPDNLGDIIYYFRFRGSFSTRMLKTQPDGLAWRIELAGRGLYKFVLGKESRIIPSATLFKIDIPDATPEIIANYALDDEQALLAIVRYNRLIDTFLSITTYSLQNHLRTTVKKIGQIEIDELYVGIDSQGAALRCSRPGQRQQGPDIRRANDTRHAGVRRKIRWGSLPASVGAVHAR